MDESRGGWGWPGLLPWAVPASRATSPEGHLCSTPDMGFAQWRAAVGHSWEARIETWHLSIQRNVLGEKGEMSFHKLLSNGEEQALFWGTWWVGRGMAECTAFQIFLLFSCVCMGGGSLGPSGKLERISEDFFPLCCFDLKSLSVFPYIPPGAVFHC